TGNRYIQFDNQHGQRKTLRLGKIPKRDDEIIRHHVKAIATAQIVGGVPDSKTARWIAEASEPMLERLVRAGLIESRKSTLLGAFITGYVAGRTDTKKSTKGAWKPTHNSLLAYFGADKPLWSITKGDARAWRV